MFCLMQTAQTADHSLIMTNDVRVLADGPPLAHLIVPRPVSQTRQKGQRGFVLITVAASAIALVGVLGMAVDIQSPGTSTAIILFRHPDGATSRLDRYNWVISQGAEARSVTSRLAPDTVLEQLDEAAIRRLFQRSMAVSRADPLAG